MINFNKNFNAGMLYGMGYGFGSSSLYNGLEIGLAFIVLSCIVDMVIAGLSSASK